MRALFLDVQYGDASYACVAGVIAELNASVPIAVYTTVVHNVAPYEPGAFFKRELPCLQAWFKEHQHMVNTHDVHVVVLDAYCVLGQDAHPGLGWHFKQSYPMYSVIGVAKTLFHDTPQHSLVYRGVSKKPFAVTALGFELEDAKTILLNMHGKHRMPTLLHLVDRCAREGLTAVVMAQHNEACLPSV